MNKSAKPEPQDLYNVTNIQPYFCNGRKHSDRYFELTFSLVKIENNLPFVVHMEMYQAGNGTIFTGKSTITLDKEERTFTNTKVYEWLEPLALAWVERVKELRTKEVQEWDRVFKLLEPVLSPLMAREKYGIARWINPLEFKEYTLTEIARGFHEMRFDFFVDHTITLELFPTVTHKQYYEGTLVYDHVKGKVLVNGKSEDLETLLKSLEHAQNLTVNETKTLFPKDLILLPTLPEKSNCHA